MSMRLDDIPGAGPAVGALTAPTSVALTCRLEEPSTASIGDIGADAGGARPHIQIQSILWHRHLLGARRGSSVEASLPLWPRKAQLTLGTKYVAVEACNPLTPA